MAHAEDGSPAALLSFGGGTLLSHLCEQLRAQGVGAISLLTRPEWVTQFAGAVPDAPVETARTQAETLEAIAAAAESGVGPMIVAHGEIATHGSMLAGLLRDPRV